MTSPSPTKATPIDIQPLWELCGGPILGFYSKGHHHTDSFIGELLKFAVRESYEDDVKGLLPGQVTRTWWRWVPCLDDGGYPGGMAQHSAEAGSRGAFKVTWWERS